MARSSDYPVPDCTTNTECRTTAQSERPAQCFMNATQFAEKARNEIEYYRARYKGMEAKVHVRDDVVGLLVTQGNLLINNSLKITEARAEALLAARGRDPCAYLLQREGTAI